MKKIKTNIEVLDHNELMLIHDTAVKILDEIGMRVPNTEILMMCKERGCIIKDDNILSLPKKVTEEYINDMRKESNHKIINEAHNVSGGISTQVYLVDYKTKTRRLGLRDDNLKGIKLTDQLSNIPSTNSAVVPSDVPYEIADAVSIADVQKYSTKPGGTYILTPTGAKYVKQINELLGVKSWYLLEIISPLYFKPDTLEMALFFAKNGASISIAPMAMSSATAPSTISGTLALQTAETLGSSFLVNTMTGDYPGFGMSCHSSDPQTMLCSFGSPNQAFFAIASSQIAKYYGIHGGANTALTDALLPDFQGGFEKGVTAALSSMSGLTSIGCQGIAGADQGFSFEQLVIDNEWMGYLNYITSGFDVTEDSIGFDIIKNVGIAGNFLGEDHTVEYMRDNYWISEIFSRYDWGNWQVNGSKSILDRANDYVERITKNYKDMEPVLDNETCRELDNIIKNAYKDVMQK